MLRSNQQKQTARAPSSSTVVSSRRKDTKFCAPLCRLLGSCKFMMLMVYIISTSSISLAVETSYRCWFAWGLARLACSSLHVTDAFFIAVYTTKLLLKLYEEPVAYYKSSYNIVDTTTLLVAFLPHVFGLQTLYALKLIKHSSRMRPLGQTMQTVMYALLLLVLLMFVFAVSGHGWYRDPKSRDTENWDSLMAALFTLFNLLTVDGWTDSQCEMDHYGFTSSHVFIVAFISLDSFIFSSNMLMVLVITKPQVPRWMTSKRLGAIMEGVCFTSPFIDLYLPCLDLQDDTLNRSVMVELVTIRETPSYKNRCLFDVLNCLLGRNGHFGAVLSRENTTDFTTSSAGSLGRYQHRNGTGFPPIRRAKAISQVCTVLVWDWCPSQMC
uniref:Cation channel sperm associated 3 n=1 Tax=Calidris pygmaea TaxID=425635 RepID=A0A8C3JD07_9CHAR